MSDDNGQDSGQSRSEGRRKDLRNKIQRSIEIAQEEQKRELLRHRIEVARKGLKQYDTKQYTDAVRSFITYIRILEDWKQVAPGALGPGSFDIQKDVAELLLINSVYWHLVKLYDGTQGPEFSQFLEKYILFTKGMRFQPLAAETLRKFTRAKGIKHKADMLNAYKMVGNTKCFIATSLVDLEAEETLPTLRDFRDRVLRRTRAGRKFIAVYYRWSPAVVARLDRSSRIVRKPVALALDGVAALIRTGFPQD